MSDIVNTPSELMGIIVLGFIIAILINIIKR